MMDPASDGAAKGNRQERAGKAVAFLTAAGKARGAFAAALLMMAVPTPASPSSALDTADLKVTYAISIAGLVIGRVDAESRFTSGGYATAIHGSTSGVSRLVSDATAILAGRGRISGTHVYPVSYNLETSENGFATHVQMAMSRGSITNVVAEPKLLPMPDRIPVTPVHKHDVLDPVGAFLVVLDKPGLPSGPRACDRTIKVFDGWQRFDIRLNYKETKAVDGNGDSYAGEVIVCGARYVPVAGHRPSREQVQYMANNKRLEIWLAPVKDMPLLVPYRIVIGTTFGDLIISATHFATDAPGPGTSMN
jgi:hypothetical protein